MKRIFDNQVNAIIMALDEILLHKKRAAKVLSKIVQQHPKWGARDRRVVYDFTFGILRWKRRLNHTLQNDDYAHDPQQWIALWGQKNEFDLPSSSPVLAVADKKISGDESPDLLTSFPQWLYALGEKELGEIWHEEAKSLNEKASICLRVNEFKTSAESLSKELREKYTIENEPLPNIPSALILKKGVKIERNPLFKKGLFEIQDAYSQKIAPFCQVQPATKVIDFCAGAGGKTLHLGALMKNKGEILAFDPSKNKLRELQKRVKRHHLTLIEAMVTDDQTDFSPLYQWADTVLIDAPCSGLGTLKRCPEIKWNLSQERLENLISIQEEILGKASALVKSNGKLIYATCSILPSENEKQVEKFLATHPHFQLEAQERISPSNSNFDGFFMARFVRK